MIKQNATDCPNCRGKLKYYDTVKRRIKGKTGKERILYIRRFKCVECRKTHRELPPDIMPYKQYESNIVNGVREGWITPETLGFEDYPCEQTMKRWCSAKYANYLMKENT